MHSQLHLDLYNGAIQISSHVFLFLRSFVSRYCILFFFLSFHCAALVAWSLSFCTRLCQTECLNNFLVRKQKLSRFNKLNNEIHINFYLWSELCACFSKAENWVNAMKSREERKQIVVYVNILIDFPSDLCSFKFEFEEKSCFFFFN